MGTVRIGGVKGADPDMQWKTSDYVEAQHGSVGNLGNRAVHGIHSTVFNGSKQHRRSRTENKMSPGLAQFATKRCLLGRSRRPPIRGHTSSSCLVTGFVVSAASNNYPGNSVCQQFDGLPQGAELPNPDYLLTDPGAG